MHEPPAGRKISCLVDGVDPAGANCAEAARVGTNSAALLGPGADLTPQSEARSRLCE